MRVVLNIFLSLRGRISFDGQCWLVSTEGRCELKGKVMMPEAKKGRKPIQLAVFVEYSNAMVGLNPGGRLRLLRMFEHIYANP